MPAMSPPDPIAPSRRAPHRRPRRRGPPPALGLLLLASLPAPAADAPRVAVDIAAVGSLVADVMGERGAPDVVVEPGASPHDRAMRPSAARALGRAELVFLTSGALTPWLVDAVEALAPEATAVELLEVPGTVRLPARVAATFGAGHDHDHDGRDGAADGPPGDGAGSGPIDPHAWLDPDNARVWLGAIADALAAADPAGADVYRANAERATAGLADLARRVEARLAPVRDRPFVVAHDGLRYFEARFGLGAAGAVVASDAVGPGPARLGALRDAIRAGGVGCVLVEPVTGERLARGIAADTGARAVEVDPLGARLEPGPGLYARLVEGVADALAECLG